MSDTVVVRDLYKSYGEFALNHLNFSLKSGKITGFIGQNGNGKTTTIKSILGLINYKGEIEIFGKNMRDSAAEIREDIGVVFDEFCFDEVLTIKDLSKIMSHLYKNWSEETFQHYIEKFKLPCNKKFKQFSRGMKVKVSLAVALSHNAKLLVLDEPTSGLDPIFRCEILDELKTFTADSENAVFFSTHITSDLEQIADQIIFIAKGNLILNESVDLLHKEYFLVQHDAPVLKHIEKTHIYYPVQKSNNHKVLIKCEDAELLDFYKNQYEKPTIDELMLYLNNES